MLSICAFPSRFATSVKRPLKKLSQTWESLSTAAKVSTARGALPSIASYSITRCQPVQNQKVILRTFSTHPSVRREFASASLEETDNDSYVFSARASHLLAGKALYGPRPDTWWTCPKPEVGDGRTPYSLPHLQLGGPNARESLISALDNSWGLTETLFSGLQGEEAFLRPPPHHLRHPLIFYYGHPAALYINKLRVAGLLDRGIDARLERLFETGVDEMSWDDLSIGANDWPSVAEVHAYRAKAYAAIRGVIDFASDEDLRSISPSSPYWSLPMSMDHERIHIETSSVLLREMPLSEELARAPPLWPAYHASAKAKDVGASTVPQAGVDYPQPQMIKVDGGRVKLGKATNYPSFGWDNEYGNRSYDVPSFSAGKYMVTNGEYWGFVSSGGYTDQSLWTKDGWAWRTFRNVKKPAFWSPCGPAGLHQYKLRCVFDEVDMPWSWPAIVCFHEAKAFAKWKGRKEGKACRVTTELEHNLIGEKYPESYDPIMSGSGNMLAEGKANLNLSVGSESPVDALPANSLGFHDTFGNAWEWCEDQFSALEGFNVSKLYDDFSTPCFDGKHQIIVGGSWASSGDLGSKFARFHFRPHFQQHAGFRIVVPDNPEEAQEGNFMTSCTDAPAPYVGEVYPFRSTDPNRVRDSTAEAAKVVQNALASHFSTALQIGTHAPTPLSAFFNSTPILQHAGQFHKHIAQISASTIKNNTGVYRALDIGCGPGGSTFELSRCFDQVLGVDLNGELLTAAKELQAKGELEYQSFSGMSEMAIVDPSLDRSKVTFRQCDPLSLPGDLVDYDLVLIHSCFDRLASPSALLGRLGGASGVVRTGGTLVIATSYEWSERYTPSSAWIKDITELGKVLGSEFKLVEERNVPKAIQEGNRTCKLSSVHVTVWRRQ